nr:carboxypeptidase-like regulatory domain-containing protein [Ardenticatena sp.]
MKTWLKKGALLTLLLVGALTLTFAPAAAQGPATTPPRTDTMQQPERRTPTPGHDVAMRLFRFLGTGRVSGSVTDSDGTPLVGVNVVLRHTVAGIVLRARTDEQGAFTIERVPAGAYTLQVRPGPKSNYAPAFYDGIIEVGFGETIDDISMVVDDGARISGTVLFDDGTPVKRVMVVAVETRLGVVRHTRVREDGTYTLERLPDGTYLVFITAASRRARGVLFYENTPSPADAIPIIVDGADVDGIDFTVPRPVRTP